MREKEFWKRKFGESVKQIGKGLPKLPPVLVGFNANIDAVKYVNKAFLTKLPSNDDEEQHINDLGDLGRGIRESIRTGRANEWEVTEKSVYRRIRAFKFDEERIGGQAGIVTNILSKLGVDNIFVTRQLSEELSKHLMNRHVKVPTIKNEELVFEKPVKAFSKKAITKVNCIFEFRKGFMNSPRSNRFIVSYRPKGLEPVLSTKLEQKIPEIVAPCRKAFLAGHTAIKWDERNKYFRKVKEQLRMMKEANEKLKLHLEFTNVEEEWLRKMMVSHAARRVHSLGMNEVETCMILETLKETALAKSIVKSKYDVEQLYKGALRIKKKLRLERVHVHNLGYFICVFDKDYAAPDKVLNAHVHAANIAETKAKLGVIRFRKDVKAISRTPLSPDGVSSVQRIGCENGVNEGKNHYVIGVPTRKARRIKSTVGLGDSISSTSFVLDET